MPEAPNENLRSEIATMLRTECADAHSALLLLAQLTGEIIQAAPAAQKGALFGLTVLAISRQIGPPLG